MTGLALEALAADSETEVVVLISKPPAESVVSQLENALGKLGKPVVACGLGVPPRVHGRVRWVTTLEDAAEAAAATVRGTAWTPRAFTDQAAVRSKLARLEARGERRGAGLLGLYTGGTLAHEARLLLEPLIGRSSFELLDLGADEFTVGRPHPMLNPEARAARVREAGRSPAVRVILLDLVLGRGTHADPARPLCAAIRDARAAATADGRALTVVASVVGTEGDPQGLAGQVAALEAAGAELLTSNAQAARFAALVVRPDLISSLVEGLS